jgi:hypothetical protein
LPIISEDGAVFLFSSSILFFSVWNWNWSIPLARCTTFWTACCFYHFSDASKLEAFSPSNNHVIFTNIQMSKNMSAVKHGSTPTLVSGILPSGRQQEPLIE